MLAFTNILLKQAQSQLEFGSLALHLQVFKGDSLLFHVGGGVCFYHFSLATEFQDLPSGQRMKTEEYSSFMLIVPPVGVTRLNCNITLRPLI